MAWLTVLLDCSEEPSVSGWKEEDIFSCTPVSLCKAFQNFDMKSLSRTETILSGSPFSQYQWSKKREARASAVKSVQVGISRTSDPRRSVIVSRQLKPLSRGKGPTKSIATLSRRLSGIGSGCRGPAGLLYWICFTGKGHNQECKTIRDPYACWASSTRRGVLHMIYQLQSVPECRERV